ncbi:GNAT family N-acetyltransferase [Oceanobacillus massiliensis]|uniref:GNAT family N-acetyltransferase n=1 Tax=Oceanobacillus massiliensis TaxID=1465765 RepID=UPI000287E292|nr:GNAT family N-acetyltransferase [Oceanobacillus massiliensis]
MNIRLLNASDAKSYWDLRLEALKQNPESFATSYEEAITRSNPVEVVAENFNSEGNFTFGAFANGDLIGVVTLLLEKQLKLRHRATIQAFYVSPKMRGCGTGKSLLLQTIRHAESIDRIEKLNLAVVSTNSHAKALYEQLGFKVFGFEERALLIGDNYYDEEYMVLFLHK